MKASHQQVRGAPRGLGYCRSRLVAAALFGATAVPLLLAGPAEAARRAHHHSRPGAVGFAPAPVGASIVLDADTGRVLSEDSADASTYPASLAKLMTLYLTFENLNSGRLRLDQYLPVSADAASHPPTKLGLQPGEAVTVRDLILAVVTRSANDAAAVLAEGEAGSEAAFAERMTQKARAIGMTNTVFRNASGLPDPEQRTTARDMAQLSLALYHDYPREYGFFATREFEFHGRIVNGHDHLLDWYPGADGLKTGYIRASGFNLATSAVHDGRRLIGVVLGGPSAGTRDRTMAALLDQGFSQLGVAPAAVVHRLPPRPTVVAAAEPGGDHLSALGKAASRLAARLSPLTNAEAAVPLRLPRAAATADRWSIQLGAFHSEAAARQRARAAAVLPVVKDKPSNIVESGKSAKGRVYRARLYDLTPQEAQKACAALKKQKMECVVVPPPLRVANR